MVCHVILCAHTHTGNGVVCNIIYFIDVYKMWRMFCICNFISWWLFTGAIRTTCVLDLETKPHYWLTVCAQDQAVVPLYSCVEVQLVLAYCIAMYCFALALFFFYLFFLPWPVSAVHFLHLSHFHALLSFPPTNIPVRLRLIYTAYCEERKYRAIVYANTHTQIKTKTFSFYS